MPPSIAVTFGDLLKHARKRAGMTQADLAAAVGYSVPFVLSEGRHTRGKIVLQVVA